MYFNCPSCEFKSENASVSNKHISECKYYDEWYKNYTPPEYIECIKCKLQFIDIADHKC